MLYGADGDIVYTADRKPVMVPFEDAKNVILRKGFATTPNDVTVAP